jgi:RimJ/RimL family protein N-acetyltransferase
MRFGDGIQTMQWVHDWLGRCLDNDQQKSGIGTWAIVEKRSREPIGYCGLFHLPDVRGGRCKTAVSIGTNLAAHLREET